MSLETTIPARYLRDRVSDVLKWVLLAVAVLGFGLFAWATVETYDKAPPIPASFVSADGTTLMTADNIVGGKAGFQKADLMDYGSLYGMVSYYGEDYTAWALIRLAKLTEDNLAQARFGKPFDALPSDQKAAIRDEMQHQLQRIDLTQPVVTIPDALAGAIKTVREKIAQRLHTVDLTTGWTPAYALNPRETLQTAEFLIYSAITTVARRPNVSWSWTENWPFEPEVGNTPTTNTYAWTWASFCFTFFCFGLVLFIYEFWLNHPDEAPMDPVLARFGPLTESQRKIWKYFLVVALVLLLQIAAGTVMAHAYYDRRSFYGLELHNWLPFNFLRCVHIQAPIIWIGMAWIGGGLFLAPAIAQHLGALERDRPVLDRPDPARTSHLGLHHQHSRPLCFRHDPSYGGGKILHHHRLLALVGGASLGRAVFRILCRQHERLSAHGRGPRVAQARRARGLFRTDPDLPRRSDRHRPSPLLGRGSEHVGAHGKHVLLHRGAAACAPHHRSDRPVPAHRAQQVFNYTLAYTYIIGRLSGISWARASPAAAR